MPVHDRKSQPNLNAATESEHHLQRSHHSAAEHTETIQATETPVSLALFGNRALGGRGNSQAQITNILRAQQAYGNRATQRLLQRTNVSATPPSKTPIQRKPGKDKKKKPNAAQNYINDPLLNAYMDAYEFVAEKEASIKRPTAAEGVGGPRVEGESAVEGVHPQHSSLESHPAGVEEAELPQSEAASESNAQEETSWYRSENGWHNYKESPNYWYSDDEQHVYNETDEKYYRLQADGSWVEDVKSTEIEEAPVVEVEEAPVVEAVSSSLSSPSSSSSSGSSSKFRKLGQKLKQKLTKAPPITKASPASNATGKAPVVPQAPSQPVASSSSSASARSNAKGKGPALPQQPAASTAKQGGIPIISGKGTNLQNAILAADAMLKSGTPEGVNPQLIRQAAALIEIMLPQIKTFETYPPAANEQVLILNLMAAVRSGDNNSLAKALKATGLDEDPEDPEDPEVPEAPEQVEDEEDEAPTNKYLKHQDEKLDQLNAEIASSISTQGPLQATASASKNVKIAKGKAMAKTVGKLAVGQVLSHSGVPGLSQGFSLALAVNQVRSTVRHIRNLDKIRADMIAGGMKETDPMVKNLDYIRGKKRNRAIRSGVGAVPFVGTAQTVGSKIKGGVKLIKGTRGVHRRQIAEKLRYDANQMNDRNAQRIILELVGKAQYKEALMAPTGADLIIAKMSST